MTSAHDVVSNNRIERAERVADELAKIGIEDPTISHRAQETINGQTVPYSQVYAGGSFDNDRPAAEDRRDEVKNVISTGSAYIHTSTPNPELNGVTHNLVIVKISEGVTSGDEQ